MEGKTGGRKKEGRRLQHSFTTVSVGLAEREACTRVLPSVNPCTLQEWVQSLSGHSLGKRGPIKDAVKDFRVQQLGLWPVMLLKVGDLRGTFLWFP